MTSSIYLTTIQINLTTQAPDNKSIIGSAGTVDYSRSAYSTGITSLNLELVTGNLLWYREVEYWERLKSNVIFHFMQNSHIAI